MVVVEGLQDVTLPAVGHHLLVAAAHHDAVGAPGQGVGRAGVEQQLALLLECGGGRGELGFIRKTHKETKT